MDMRESIKRIEVELRKDESKQWLAKTAINGENVNGVSENLVSIHFDYTDGEFSTAKITLIYDEVVDD